MRVLGNIEHPRMKITVFKMDSKLSIKFENPHSEISFKLKDNPMVNDFDSAKAWIDQSFLKEAEDQLSLMHTMALNAFKRRGAAATADDFDEII